MFDVAIENHFSKRSVVFSVIGAGHGVLTDIVILYSVISGNETL